MPWRGHTPASSVSRPGCGWASEKGLTGSMLFFQAAYVLLWALLLGYVFHLGRRQRRLEEELVRLRQVMGQR